MGGARRGTAYAPSEESDLSHADMRNSDDVVRTYQSDTGKISCKAMQTCVKEANHMLEEEHAAENAVIEINVVLRENNADVTFALLKKHRRLLEFPPLADVPHK